MVSASMSCFFFFDVGELCAGFLCGYEARDGHVDTTNGLPCRSNI